MKTNNPVFTLIIAGFFILLYFTAPQFTVEPHNHKKAILHYPSGFEWDTVGLCNDSTMFRYGRHIAIDDSTRDWIECIECPIIDKP